MDTPMIRIASSMSWAIFSDISPFMPTRSGFLFPRSPNGILRRLRAVIRTVSRPKPASIGRNREIADELFEPHFKPDFNIDLLRSVNYICHLFVVKKELVEKHGGFRAEFDGAQDYDFIFRMVENAKNIVHIPKVLSVDRKSVV